MKQFKIKLSDKKHREALEDALSTSGVYLQDENKDEVDYTRNETTGEYNIPFSDNSELFDLGKNYGEQIFKEQPQKFHLHKDYCDLLRKAIELWQNESRVVNSSISFMEPEMSDSEMELIYIQPTNITFLFGVFSTYGTLKAQKELA